MSVDFCILQFYTLPVKRFIFITTLLFVVSFSLFADLVFWVGKETKGDEWSNSMAIVFSDKYSPGSILNLQNGDKNVTVTVLSGLKKTMEGREMALTSSILKDLDLWMKGDQIVNVELLKGSLKSYEEKDIDEESGWYSLKLRAVDSKRSGEIYKTLASYGLKANSEIVDNKVVFTLPYIASYEIEEKISLLNSLSLDVEEIEITNNPYL